MANHPRATENAPRFDSSHDRRERDAGGIEILSLPGVDDVGLLAQPDRLAELASPPGGLAVALEILGAQARLIEGLVGLERLAPQLAGSSVASNGRRIDYLRHARIVTPAVNVPDCLEQ